MIIEETISDSFTLDFEILKNFTLEENFKLMMPKLKSHDILKEFEKYVEQIKGKFLDFTKIFDVLTKTPFLDWAHIDEVGTAKVAEEMFAVLKPLLTK